MNYARFSNGLITKEDDLIFVLSIRVCIILKALRLHFSNKILIIIIIINIRKSKKVIMVEATGKSRSKKSAA